MNLAKQTEKFETIAPLILPCPKCNGFRQFIIIMINGNLNFQCSTCRMNFESESLLQLCEERGDLLINANNMRPTG